MLDELKAAVGAANYLVSRVDANQLPTLAFLAKHGDRLIAAVELAEATLNKRAANVLAALPLDPEIMVHSRAIAEKAKADADMEYLKAVHAYRKATTEATDAT